jgi:hypothetical protein
MTNSTRSARPISARRTFYFRAIVRVTQTSRVEHCTAGRRVDALTQRRVVLE